MKITYAFHISFTWGKRPVPLIRGLFIIIIIIIIIIITIIIIIKTEEVLGHVGITDEPSFWIYFKIMAQDSFIHVLILITENRYFGKFGHLF
jgi:hypothetical protein